MSNDATGNATPPTPPHVPPGKKPLPAVLVVVPVLGVVTMGLFFLVWQFLTPAEHHQPVPYSDFMMEVHAGHVEDIKIHDREIVFRVRGENGHGIVKETIGPVPDQALFDSLKPTDPNVPPPKVFFEK